MILGTSDAWSTIHFSHRPSDPAYYIEDCRILALLSARIGYLSLIFKQETWQGYLLQRNLDSRLIDTR